jgi:hypothetical protein
MNDQVEERVYRWHRRCLLAFTMAALVLLVVAAFTV